MCFANLILFLLCLFSFFLQLLPYPPLPLPHFHHLFFFCLSNVFLPVLSLPYYVPCTFQHHSEQVFLSLLSLIPPLLAAKLKKWSTQMTPSSHCFCTYNVFIPSSQSPLFLNIFLLLFLFSWLWIFVSCGSRMKYYFTALSPVFDSLSYSLHTINKAVKACLPFPQYCYLPQPFVD